MQLLKLIESVAKGNAYQFGINNMSPAEFDHIDTIHQFLYNSPYHSQHNGPIKPEAQAIIAKYAGTDDDFTLLGYGANNTVFGNKNKVFRLCSPGGDRDHEHSLPPEEIPPGLAAETYATGTCNGIYYSLGERLHTETLYRLTEIIPFLFRARKAGVSYYDPKSENFGRDTDGQLKVIDNEHFQKLGVPPRNFEESLEWAISQSYQTVWPLLISDEASTIVLFDKSANNVALHKRMLASLEAVGIPRDEVQTLRKPPLVRIPHTQVTYGSPPQEESLADYLSRSLTIDRKAESPAERLVLDVSAALKKLGENAFALANDLPPLFMLDGMSKKDFSQLYEKMNRKLALIGIEENDAVDAAFDAYFKTAYPARPAASR